MTIASTRAGESSAPREGASASSDATVGPEELRALADRALLFQGYLLRRAWGVYYLIWSAALIGFFVVPAVLAGPLNAAPLWAIVLYYAYLIALIALAIWATSWAFTQSVRAIRLRDLGEPRREARRRFLQILGIGLAIAALVFAVSFVSSFAGLLVLDVALGGIILAVVFQVRSWFELTPPEGIVAIATFATSIVGSAIALVFTDSQVWFGAVWTIAIVGWGFSGAYALYHAPEEMTAHAP